MVKGKPKALSEVKTEYEKNNYTIICIMPLCDIKSTNQP